MPVVRYEWSFDHASSAETVLCLFCNIDIPQILTRSINADSIMGQLDASHIAGAMPCKLCSMSVNTPGYVSDCSFETLEVDESTRLICRQMQYT